MWGIKGKINNRSIDMTLNEIIGITSTSIKKHVIFADAYKCFDK